MALSESGQAGKANRKGYLVALPFSQILNYWFQGGGFGGSEQHFQEIWKLTEFNNILDAYIILQYSLNS